MGNDGWRVVDFPWMFFRFEISRGLAQKTWSAAENGNFTKQLRAVEHQSFVAWAHATSRSRLAIQALDDAGSLWKLRRAICLHTSSSFMFQVQLEQS